MPFTVELILSWADKHHAKHGKWPTIRSGKVPGKSSGTWTAIQSALGLGSRGLEGGTSLARLLARHRDRRNPRDLPAHSYSQILKWADRWKREFGSWPRPQSGAIPFAPGETWSGIQAALVAGLRGLPGGETLVGLLVRCRGLSSRSHRPKLSKMQIRKWAKAYHSQNGRWPTCSGGVIPDSNGEFWRTVDYALRRGKRGFPGGSSLSQLLRPLKLKTK